MRRLTLEEAETVTAAAREEGERPVLFNSQSLAEEEISRDFEAYLILTPPSVTNSVSGFFQTILDNDPNNVELRTKLFSDFLDEEKRNELERQRGFQQLTEYYDQVRESVSASLEGYEDVTEAVLLQETLVRSLGDIVASRDRHAFNYAALSVLTSRLEAGGFADFREELQSWIRVLVEYD